MSEQTGPVGNHGGQIEGRLSRMESDIHQIKTALLGDFGSEQGMVHQLREQRAEIGRLSARVLAVESNQATARDKAIDRLMAAGVSLVVGLGVAMVTHTFLR